MVSQAVSARSQDQHLTLRRGGGRRHGDLGGIYLGLINAVAPYVHHGFFRAVLDGIGDLQRLVDQAIDGLGDHQTEGRCHGDAESIAVHEDKHHLVFAGDNVADEGITGTASAHHDTQVLVLTADGDDQVTVAVDIEQGHHVNRHIAAVHNDEFSVDGPIQVVVEILDGDDRGVSLISLGTRCTGVTLVAFGAFQGEGYGGAVCIEDGEALQGPLNLLHEAAFLPLPYGNSQAGDL